MHCQVRANWPLTGTSNRVDLYSCHTLLCYIFDHTHKSMSPHSFDFVPNLNPAHHIGLPCRTTHQPRPHSSRRGWGCRDTPPTSRRTPPSPTWRARCIPTAPTSAPPSARCRSGTACWRWARGRRWRPRCGSGRPP